ncbi:hypothetical protein BOV88_13430 [Solemya velum gill symbiont]|uniref:HTH cro/C1-type domain-containing protein n=1 Tax=Solemya velum gill symbiont TaxID=2340 RepID=A0A1T2CNM2_SOVGS|nr:hypothetical protein [Solemya velum gill symbiont]OOY33781.1 hypothetical protein BOV88_13430 [Solemya velum gill symbiont]OOY36426.1 hypothetical protein BOV89_12625 [Solemya velum gill symbiont]OOY45195.1 hypothetical protein BOV93_13525 [Solemya velum gill symbiont]OOY49075.1 hypothetical protein BOV94_12490 [Solemya velum gill symbiont]OOZ10479.1 hypothetical protein BOW25_13090 [Solemya velum gill symbiont]
MKNNGTIDIFIRNLKMVKGSLGWSNRDISRHGGPSDRMVGMILNRESEPGIDVIERIGIAFKLPPYLLLTPYLRPDMLDSIDEISTLLCSFINCDAESRDFIIKLVSKAQQPEKEYEN